MTMHKPCRKCNRTLRELMLEAMAADAGAEVYPHPLDCDHDFAEELEKPR